MRNFSAPNTKKLVSTIYESCVMILYVGSLANEFLFREGRSLPGVIDARDESGEPSRVSEARNSELP